MFRSQILGYEDLPMPNPSPNTRKRAKLVLNLKTSQREIKLPTLDTSLKNEFGIIGSVQSKNEKLYSKKYQKVSYLLDSIDSLRKFYFYLKFLNQTTKGRLAYPHDERCIFGDLYIITSSIRQKFKVYWTESNPEEVSFCPNVKLDTIEALIRDNFTEVLNMSEKDYSKLMDSFYSEETFESPVKEEPLRVVRIDGEERS